MALHLTDEGENKAEPELPCLKLYYFFFPFFFN